MSEFVTVNEILDFAIEKEREAASFYRDLARSVGQPHMKSLFEGFAVEEDKHESKLEDVKKGGELKPSDETIPDLKISDYLLEVEVSDSMDYQDALILAMGREKNSFKLYTDLAKLADNQKTRDVFAALAQEEAKHKLYLELEYDEHILKED